MMKRIGYALAACLVSGNIVMAQTAGKAEPPELTQDMKDEIVERLASEARKVDFEIVGEYRKLIEDNLEVGASATEIEAFFDKHDISYSFGGRFDNRYRAMIRDVENDSIWTQSVVIRIYVDQDKKFVRAEVYDVFK